jgi:hypothetical protein
MAGKSTALADRFDMEIERAVATREGLSDTDWHKVTAAEGWPEGVTAYNGWANRLLFGASYLWLIIAARVSWRGARTGQSECSVSFTNRRQA